METPYLDTPLSLGVYEAGSLDLLGAKRCRKFVCHDLIELFFMIVKVLYMVTLFTIYATFAWHSLMSVLYRVR